MLQFSLHGRRGLRDRHDRTRLGEGLSSVRRPGQCIRCVLRLVRPSPRSSGSRPAKLSEPSYGAPRPLRRHRHRRRHRRRRGRAPDAAEGPCRRRDGSGSVGRTGGVRLDGNRPSARPRDTLRRGRRRGPDRPRARDPRRAGYAARRGDPAANGEADRGSAERPRRADDRRVGRHARGRGAQARVPGGRTRRRHAGQGDAGADHRRRHGRSRHADHPALRDRRRRRAVGRAGHRDAPRDSP